MKIRTTYLHPSIPARQFDWCAYDEDTYDGAEDSSARCRRVGYGATRIEAIGDLIEQMTDELSESDQ